MPLLCFLLFLVYGISIFVVSFSAFRLNNSMRAWVDRVVESTETGLIELARLSDVQALKAFSSYMGVSAVVLVICSVLLGHFFASEIKELLFGSGILLGWGALSINAWSKNRTQILENFMLEAKQDVQKFVKYYLVFSAILVLLVTTIALSVGSFAYANLAPALFLIIVGVVVIVSAVAVASSISLGMVFGPALLALAYLWGAIFLARAVVVVGRAWLQNALVLYSIIFTLYLGLLSLPALRVSLGIPALCQ